MLPTALPRTHSLTDVSVASCPVSVCRSNVDPSAGGFPGRANTVCFVDSYSRVVVMAGKLANSERRGSEQRRVDGHSQLRPLTATTTFTWAQQSAAAPFTPRDGPLGATYFSTALQPDVYYVSGGYAYENAVAQYQEDSGVGDSEVWASLDQGVTWKLIANNQFPPRYHAKMLATKDGVLVMVAGANAPPPTRAASAEAARTCATTCGRRSTAATRGVSAPHSCSLWRAASTRRCPTRSCAALGVRTRCWPSTRRPATCTWDRACSAPAGSAANPTDLYRTSISFYDIGQVAGLCGDLTIPALDLDCSSRRSAGMLATQLTACRSFLAASAGRPVRRRLVLRRRVHHRDDVCRHRARQQCALVVFGGRLPGHGSVQSQRRVVLDVAGSQWSQVVVNGGYTSESYGPATCVDVNQQVLYSVGGDSASDDQGGHQRHLVLAATCGPDRGSRTSAGALPRSRQRRVLRGQLLRLW